MDLTINLENTILNIRVAVILKTRNGFVLGKGENKKYYHFPGGRIKLGENSLQAAKREILEEAGIELENLEFVCVIENFWTEPNHKVQELCFVYETKIANEIFPNIELKEFTKEEIANMDIRPEILKKIVLEDRLSNVTHYIV